MSVLTALVMVTSLPGTVIVLHPLLDAEAGVAVVVVAPTALGVPVVFGLLNLYLPPVPRFGIGLTLGPSGANGRHGTMDTPLVRIGRRGWAGFHG